MPVFFIKIVPKINVPFISALYDDCNFTHLLGIVKRKICRNKRNVLC